jgi:hypothetical protein
VADNSNESGRKEKIWSKSWSPSDSGSVHPFIGWEIQEAAHVNEDPIPTNLVLNNCQHNIYFITTTNNSEPLLTSNSLVIIRWYIK